MRAFSHEAEPADVPLMGFYALRCPAPGSRIRPHQTLRLNTQRDSRKAESSVRVKGWKM